MKKALKRMRKIKRDGPVTETRAMISARRKRAAACAKSRKRAAGGKRGR